MKFYNNIITSMYSENNEIEQEPQINRIYSLPTDHQIITKTELNQYEKNVTDRNQYQKHSEKSWYELDKKTFENVQFIWIKDNNQVNRIVNNYNDTKDLLKKKSAELQYILDFPLNNRSFGLQISMNLTLAKNQYIQIYNRSNKELNNKQSYRITLINKIEIQIRISVFKGNKFKMWREVEIPSQSNRVQVLIIDNGGNRSKILVNQYEIELPELIPIFTDFFLHLKKSRNTQVQKIEIKYFDRLNKFDLGYGCNKCIIF